MDRKRHKKPPLELDTVKQLIVENIEAQRQCGRRAVLTFIVKINERKEIEDVEVILPKMRLT